MKEQEGIGDKTLGFVEKAGYTVAVVGLGLWGLGYVGVFESLSAAGNKALVAGVLTGGAATVTRAVT